MGISRRRIVGPAAGQGDLVTRSEFANLRDELRLLLGGLPTWISLAPKESEDPLVDDGYVFRFAGDVEFLGHIDALGLDIDAGTTNDPPDDNRVRWLWDDGVPVAEMFSYYDGQYASLSVETVARGTTGTDGRSLLDLHADDINGDRRAEFEVLDNPGSSPRSRVRAYAWSDDRLSTEGRTIIDGDGRSEFLQLLTLANRQVAFGADSVTGDGDPVVDDVVAHGLGVVPVFAIAICANSTINVATNALDSTNVTFQFRNVNDANWSLTLDYYWLAIG